MEKIQPTLTWTDLERHLRAVYNKWVCRSFCSDSSRLLSTVSLTQLVQTSTCNLYIVQVDNAVGLEHRPSLLLFFLKLFVAFVELRSITRLPVTISLNWPWQTNR